MKKLLILSFVMSLLFSCQPKKTQPAASSFEAKADSIIALMTLQEKIGQLNLPGGGDITTGQASSTGTSQKIREGKVGGLLNMRSVPKLRHTQKIAVEESRLKIPLLFAMDVIHGHRTIFPIPLGLSCTWDMELIEGTARMAAQEATADGIFWNFSPMVDVSRDPRWGRISEGSGEDPYLGSQIARAMVRGYQGDDLSKKNTMLACVKHFALYGAPEAGRDYNTVDMSRLRMYNDYFPPYKAAVDEGVGTVMASFNDVDGVPASGSKWLMTEVLRNQWGFEGFVVTDYTGIMEMVYHGVGNIQEVSAQALNAGVDMDMIGESFLNNLEWAVKEGKVSEQQIEKAVRRILIAKYQLGLFDDPYRYFDEERAKNEIYTPQNRKYAREVASQSLVLLKNEGNLLPLAKKGNIAVIGPMGDNRVNMSGTWSVSGDFKSAHSMVDGIKAVLGDQGTVRYAKGANVYEDPELEARVSRFGKSTERDERSEATILAEAVALARRSDVVVAVVGEASESSGESSSLTDISMPANQQRLLQALLKTGKPVVMVLFTGRPLAIKWESENVPAILNAWFAGSEAGLAVADVLFGDVNPSAKLSVTFPQTTGQIPIYYSYKKTGRPLGEGKWFEKFKSNYLDVSNEALYPFGFGLSYTSFDYGKMEVSSINLKAADQLTVSVNVTNSGKVPGKEVVQLYIRDVVGSITRPVKELKGFEKILLQPGETRKVSFDVTVEDLKFYNYDSSGNGLDMKFDWEPGDFEVMVGSSSDDVQSISVNWTE